MTNETKQTAVDIFHDKVNDLIRGKKTITSNDIGQIWLECKEMEKEQTMNFALDYMMQSKPVVDFYNETYGGNK